MDWSTAAGWLPLLFKGFAAYLTLKLILGLIGGAFTVLVAANLAASAIKSVPGILWRGMRGTTPAAPLYPPPGAYYPPPYYPPPPHALPQAGAPNTAGLLETPAALSQPAPDATSTPIVPLKNKSAVFKRNVAFAIGAVVLLLLARSLSSGERKSADQMASENAATAANPSSPSPPPYTAIAYAGMETGTPPPIWARKNAEWIRDYISQNVCKAEDNNVCSFKPEVGSFLGHDMKPTKFWVLLMEWKLMNRLTDAHGTPVAQYCTQVYTLPALGDGQGHYEKIDPWANTAADAVIDVDHPPNIAMNLDFTWCSTEPGGTKPGGKN